MRLVYEVAFRRLDQRLAAHLVAQHPNKDGDTINITHQALADALGTSREIVSRILESFETEGLVNLERRRITVLHPERLMRMTAPPA